MMHSFSLFDKVRVLDGENRLVKEGIIVKLGSHGANVYQPQCEYPFSDTIDFAEWFPFDSKERKILPFHSKSKRQSA